ncbi:YlmC/YmxH family sporulation protein [Halanaerobacter jeridensis]|uniref:YlmC/YmxH family sporulation protein n=1 Tax=Halanaerobacter jeridensis TaxID=706427 RepID=A0A939BPN5_9FIRM|nr:YlmC/YmxH family sporulation protein [Halanaerobacter jeridensis]
MKTSELSAKDVVNISNGQRLGEVVDVDINLNEGMIKGIMIPQQSGIFNFLSQQENIYISWDDIHKIGEDVILVKLIKDEKQLLD